LPSPQLLLDNALLAALGVGAPIGLGVHFAWVHRDWLAGTKMGGFVGAMGGALGANLILILYLILRFPECASLATAKTLLVCDHRSAGRRPRRHDVQASNRPKMG
jgi:hypothetical protein